MIVSAWAPKSESVIRIGSTFAGLMILFTAATVAFDQRQVWQKLGDVA